MTFPLGLWPSTAQMRFFLPCKFNHNAFKSFKVKVIHKILFQVDLIYKQKGLKSNVFISQNTHPSKSKRAEKKI